MDVHCLKCSNKYAQVILDKYPTIEIRCPICGPHFLERNDQGKIESPEQKMQRMAVVHTCKTQTCKKTFVRYMDRCENKIEFCDECLAKHQSIASARRNRAVSIARKSNSASPWRKFVRYKEKASVDV